jgi:hypothetical protein
MDEERKLALLRKIAHAFTQAQISWALGASCFLYLQGIAPTFHDLDLMVKEADAPKAVEILSSLGQRFPEHYDRARYGTALFAEFVIEGIDIDMIAGFSIIASGVEHRYPLDESSIVGFADLEGEKIPVESLMAWRERYALMGRQEKVAMIDAALQEPRRFTPRFRFFDK